MNTPFGTTLSATVLDQFHNPVATTVTFAGPASGVGGTFTGGSTSDTVATTGGVATSSVFTANGTAGTYAITVSTSEVGGPTTTLVMTNRTVPGAPTNVTASAVTRAPPSTGWLRRATASAPSPAT